VPFHQVGVAVFSYGVCNCGYSGRKLELWNVFFC